MMIDTRGWQIIVVEDDDDSREVVTEALLYFDSGMEVVAVADGSECLAVLEQVRPTAVIIDLALPGLDGWATLATIRDNPSLADVPVVAMTGYHSVNVQIDALEAGFTAYFPKPIDVFSFGEQLAEIIQP